MNYKYHYVHKKYLDKLEAIKKNLYVENWLSKYLNVFSENQANKASMEFNYLIAFIYEQVLIEAGANPSEALPTNKKFIDGNMDLEDISKLNRQIKKILLKVIDNYTDYKKVSAGVSRGERCTFTLKSIATPILTKNTIDLTPSTLESISTSTSKKRKPEEIPPAIFFRGDKKQRSTSYTKASLEKKSREELLKLAKELGPKIKFDPDNFNSKDYKITNFDWIENPPHTLQDEINLTKNIRKKLKLHIGTMASDFGVKTPTLSAQLLGIRKTPYTPSFKEKLLEYFKTKNPSPECLPLINQLEQWKNVSWKFAPSSDNFETLSNAQLIEKILNFDNAQVAKEKSAEQPIITNVNIETNSVRVSNNPSGLFHPINLPLLPPSIPNPIRLFENIILPSIHSPTGERTLPSVADFIAMKPST